MIRKIIHIDEEKCNGCGLCAEACHEGAIGMRDGKAKLLRDDYCDGLGDCLPACPMKAISFVEREAAAYDKAAVEENMKKRGTKAPVFTGCPGSRAQSINHPAKQQKEAGTITAVQTQLMQWPVQLKLVPVNAPYFENANLLIAADCTAYAYGNFHQEFMRKNITLIGCPKLDEGDYAEKITQILLQNEIKRITVVRMEVPCCGGIENAVRTALQNSGKVIPWQVVTISTDGKLLDD